MLFPYLEEQPSIDQLVCHTKFPNLRNYINHGSKNGDDGAAKGFSIETLPAITSFKLGKLGEETRWCNCVNL